MVIENYPRFIYAYFLTGHRSLRHNWSNADAATTTTSAQAVLPGPLRITSQVYQVSTLLPRWPGPESPSSSRGPSPLWLVAQSACLRL